MTVMIVLLIAAVLIAALNFIPLIADSEYSEKRFSLVLKAGIITVFKSGRKPKKKKREDGAKIKAKPSAEKEKKKKKIPVEAYPDIIRDVLGILKKIPGKIKCAEFRSDIRFSSGDAAQTGELCGAFWAFVGMIFPIAAKTVDFKNTPEINFTPLFDGKCFELKYKGIFYIRLYHIIALALFALFKMKKYINYKAVD